LSLLPFVEILRNRAATGEGWLRIEPTFVVRLVVQIPPAAGLVTFVEVNVSRKPPNAKIHLPVGIRQK
jgi:hypothetical protein